MGGCRDPQKIGWVGHIALPLAPPPPRIENALNAPPAPGEQLPVGDIACSERSAMCTWSSHCLHHLHLLPAE